MAFASVNPATGVVEATFPGHTPDEVDRRIGAARDAFERYRRTSFADRARWMLAAADILDAEQPDVARMVTAEMGKTFASAKAEVAKCALALRWFAEHAERLLAEEPVASSGSRASVRYEPLGPVLAVMPWNVPQTALFLEDLFRRAGVPEGVFTTLLISGASATKLVADERIAAVTLTGSEQAGRSVAAAAGDAIKKCVLELGGSDPFIVLESADLDRAVAVGV